MSSDVSTCCSDRDPVHLVVFTRADGRSVAARSHYLADRCRAAAVIVRPKSANVPAMGIRDSGMPEIDTWASFFEPVGVLERLVLTSAYRDVFEFGCSYGTFTQPAARCARHGPAFGRQQDLGLPSPARTSRLRVPFTAWVKSGFSKGGSSALTPSAMLARIEPHMLYLSLARSMIASVWRSLLRSDMLSSRLTVASM